MANTEVSTQGRLITGEELARMADLGPCRSVTDVREFRETDRLQGDDVLSGFDVPVASLFEE
jgi:hypothetical protein